MKVFVIASSIFLFVFIALLTFTDLCIACGCVICINPEYSANEPILKTINVDEFNSKLEENVILIDIRTLDEFNSGHIDDAINIDFYSPLFRSELNALDKNKTYLIYCRTGSRTSQAMNIMKSHGFVEVYELNGGITAWSRSGRDMSFSR